MALARRLIKVPDTSSGGPGPWVERCELCRGPSARSLLPPCSVRGALRSGFPDGQLRRLFEGGEAKDPAARV